jgi:hypothetical protein
VIAARAYRLFIFFAGFRREAPPFNSADRQVGAGARKIPEARRADMIMPVLRTSPIIVCA